MSTRNTFRHVAIPFFLLFSMLLGGYSYARVAKADLPIPASDTAVKAPPPRLTMSLGLDLVSRYIWRGVEYGVPGKTATPNFQPTAGLAYDLGKGHSLGLGVWGSYAFDGDYEENDFYFNYTVAHSFGSLSVTVNDYYYPYQNIPFSNTDGDGKGAHTVDAQFLFTLPESFPLGILLSNNIHNDAPDNKSFYAELSYPFTISENAGSVFIGAAKGPSAWHVVSTDKFELINVGFKYAKVIKVTDSFSFTSGVSWIFNPHLKKTYLVFKITL